MTHFLEYVGKTEPEPLQSLAQARSALTLLYGGVLGIDLGELPQPRPPRLLDQLRLVLRVLISLRPDLLERHVPNRVLAPVLVIEVPPLRRVDREALGLHLAPE